MEKITAFLKSLVSPAAPGPEFNFYIPMIILAGLLIVGGMVFGFFYDKKKKTDFAFKRLFAKVSRNLYIFGALFLFLVAVRYESIPYFSMRLWIYISLAALIYVAYRNIQKYRTEYQLESENLSIRAEKAKESKAKGPKYLPNKKRKK